MKNSLLDFCKLIKELSPSYYNAYLKDGQMFKEKLNNDIINNFIKKIEIKKNQCFRNSLLLAIMYSGKLDYFEGFYVSNKILIPIKHSWNVTNAGLVLDSTLHKHELVTDSDVYYGSKVPRSFLIEYLKDDKFLDTPLAYYLLKKTCDK